MDPVEKFFAGLNQRVDALNAYNSGKSDSFGVVEIINSLDDTARMKAMREIESEITLEQAREVPLMDMTQEELAVVILHDPDLSERRAALRLYKLDILQEIEAKHLRMMADVRKAVR